MSNTAAAVTSAIAYFGGGCFWCTEAIFNELRGVSEVISGYAGGTHPNPNYFKVSEELTGHAEVVKVVFDPAVITYDQLLDVFFHTHNPTSLNQQGYDQGTQYRSLILTDTADQEKAAQAAIAKYQPEFSEPIVTEVAPLKEFFTAEEYHQKYYQHNQNERYCQLVIDPKLAKFRQQYKMWLKDAT